VFGEVYGDIEDYENATKFAKKGLDRLAELEQDLGSQLSQ